MPHLLLRNGGDGTFRDISAEQRLRADGAGLGVVIADLDDNGRPDIYVGNDAAENFLYQNDGGRLVERGGPAGVALDESGEYDGSMGVDVGDYDGSGRAAIWVTNYQDELHALYVQPGQRLLPSPVQGRRHCGPRARLTSDSARDCSTSTMTAGKIWSSSTATCCCTPRQRPRQPAVLMANVEFQGRRFFEEHHASAAGPYFRRSCSAADWPWETSITTAGPIW